MKGLIVVFVVYAIISIIGMHSAYLNGFNDGYHKRLWCLSKKQKERYG